MRFTRSLPERLVPVEFGAAVTVIWLLPVPDVLLSERNDLF